MAKIEIILLKLHPSFIFYKTTLMNAPQFAWPYPALIAHRGAGKHAPENTLSAMREGAKCHYKMFEYDVKLSKDGVAILLHDDCVDRTSNGKGLASQLNLAELLELDFGQWHSASYAGEAILSLHGVANFCIANHIHSNIEIKPCTGFEAVTGAAVAALAARLWRHSSLVPLLSSFSTVALKTARLAAPHLPLGWLLEEELTASWLDTAKELGVVSLHLNNEHVKAEHIQAIRTEGFAVCVWTANCPDRVKQLLEWGCDSVVTDAVREIPPDVKS